MRFFFQYLKDHIWPLLLFLLCVGIFAAVFALYHLPLAAVLYPACLCAALILIFCAAETCRRIKKHRALLRLQSLPEALCEALQDYDGADDRDYQALIGLLCDREAKERAISDEAMSDMVDYYTTWVHQIKTPLSSMHLALQDEDSPMSRRLSDDLFRIEQYVEMVLTYLRLDAGPTDYVFRECALDTVIKGSLRKFAGQFIGRNIGLSFTETGETVVTDEKWLAFVLEQLLANALKYTPQGTVSVYMEAPGILCIHDTGIGIAACDLPRIFEKGYTGRNGRTDKAASGLGLYLCRRVCENLGHGISAESVLGEGTCFRLDLSQSRTRYE